MRVLIYAPNYLPATRYGGPIKSSSGLAHGLVALGHSVEVFTSNEDGPRRMGVPLGTPVDLDGVRVRYFALNVPRRLYFSAGMLQAFRDEIPHFDVVHINGMFLWPGPAAAAIARKHGVPYVISPRGMLASELISGRSRLAKVAWLALLEKRSLRHARAIHVTSQQEALGVQEVGLDLAPLHVIGNGVEIPSAEVPEAAVEAIWSGVPRGRRVAFLGRLDWTKGVDLAIKAVAIAAPMTGARLIIAGPDQIGLRAKLEGQIPFNGCYPVAQFVGPVDGNDKWALLKGADVLVAPSVRESFGMSVAEALAVGTPVVCTEGVGARSIIDKIAPANVVPRTAREVANAICNLLQDPCKREIYGSSARTAIIEDYSWFKIAQKMENMYNGQLQGAEADLLA